MRANNLFLNSCYEGNVNLNLIKNAFQRRAMKAQISEYGQIPKQLFKLPMRKKMSKAMMVRSLKIADPL